MGRLLQKCIDITSILAAVCSTLVVSLILSETSIS